MSKKKIYILSFLIAVVIISCRKDDEKKVEPQEFKLTIPSNFPAVQYDLNANPVTKEGFELGKMIFYDPILSRDSTISCGSCHIQYSAFTHTGHSVSHGIDNKLGKRNTPPVMNLLWTKNFLWDGGIHNLDFVPINAIESPVEMDEKTPHVLEKMRRTDRYPQAFARAFGSDEITSQKFFKALSQFMLMLVSANSKYDQYVRGEGAALSADEMEGLQLFQQKCASCHSTDLFTDQGFHNNGIKSEYKNDAGLYNITANPSDSGKFRVPTLRNLLQSAPYMHDGSFPDLQSVLDHYASGVKLSNTLDTSLNKNGVLGIPMTENEKKKIIAFLGTLTDMSFVTDPRFSE